MWYSGKHTKQLPVFTELLLLGGHRAPVSSAVAVGRCALATISESEHFIEVWDHVKGRRIQTLLGHWKPIRLLAATGEDELMSVSEDNTTRFWAVKRGKVIKTLVHLSVPGPISSAAGDSTGAAPIDLAVEDVVFCEYLDEGMCFVVEKAQHGNALDALGGHAISVYTNRLPGSVWERMRHRVGQAPVVSVCRISDRFVATAHADLAVLVWECPKLLEYCIIDLRNVLDRERRRARSGASQTGDTVPASSRLPRDDSGRLGGSPDRRKELSLPTGILEEPSSPVPRRRRAASLTAAFGAREFSGLGEEDPTQRGPIVDRLLDKTEVEDLTARRTVDRICMSALDEKHLFVIVGELLLCKDVSDGKIGFVSSCVLRRKTLVLWSDVTHVLSVARGERLVTVAPSALRLWKYNWRASGVRGEPQLLDSLNPHSGTILGIRQLSDRSFATWGSDGLVVVWRDQDEAGCCRDEFLQRWLFSSTATTSGMDGSGLGDPRASGRAASSKLAGDGQVASEDAREDALPKDDDAYEAGACMSDEINLPEQFMDNPPADAAAGRIS